MLNINEGRTLPDEVDGATVWVLVDKGKARYGGQKLELQEFTWRLEAWRPTGKNKWVGLYKGLREADWIGKLPHMGRFRRTRHTDLFMKAAELYEKGYTVRAVCSELRMGRTPAMEVRKRWLAARTLDT